MSNETVEFEHGSRTYRIQYDVEAPALRLVKRPGEVRVHTLPPEFKVASIRVTETTEGMGDAGPMQILIFGRGFATLPQARSGAAEHAKRFIREQLSRRLVPEPGPTPVI